MKVVLLAGGLGTRLAEETESRPKPMVEIGGRPILWHVMKNFAKYGHHEFYVCLGYKGEVIKRYFRDYQLLAGNISIDLHNGRIERFGGMEDQWTVHLMETGQDSMTGGRVLRLREHLADEPFLVTYGDGVANVDIDALIAFHKQHGKLATITAVRPPSRFGALSFEGDLVKVFTEKPQMGEGWINGGFMVLDPRVFQYFKLGDATVLEAHVLEELAQAGELTAFRHAGFWQCMDTLRDKRHLQALWDSGATPWL